MPGTTKNTFEITKELFFELLSQEKVDEIKNCMYVPYPNDYQNYKKWGITIISDNWYDYDRQSFPVFRNETLTAEEIWQQYLGMSKLINEAWIINCGLNDISEIPIINDNYTEYVVENYNLN